MEDVTRILFPTCTPMARCASTASPPLQNLQGALFYFNAVQFLDLGGTPC